MALATPADFERIGLRKEALSPRRSVVSLVDPATDRLAINAHGWSGDEPLQFELGASIPGSTTPALPGGLSASIVYYPLPVPGSDTLFAVSTSIGGAPIAIADAGAGTLIVRQGLGPIIARTLEVMSDVVASAVPADFASSSLAPIWVTCKLAAFDLAIVQGLMEPGRWQEGKETLGEQVKFAKELLKSWQGSPPRKPVTDGTDPIQGGAWVDSSPLGADGFGLTSCGEEAIG